MQINVNGQNYAKWEDVPAEVRQQLAATLPDADKNGVPDLFEGNFGGVASADTQAFTAISVNGQSVNSVAELPPEVQQMLHQAFGWAAPSAPPYRPRPAPPPLPPRPTRRGRSSPAR